MSTDRRFVLKGLAAAGLLAAMPWAQASASAATPLADAAARVTPLVSGGALDAAFLAGVRNAAAKPAGALVNPPLQGLEAATYQQLDRLLNDDTPTLLVGLLDDAAAVLVLDLVRSAGGRVLSVEHHRIGAGSAGQQRAGALGQALVAGADAAVTAGRVHENGSAYVALRCVI
ncbi:hypothetical protein [Malikia sp.]|uniref:hypothetical protein n=1 Tax=Malikia sp. TaxID=2070706 RepID=UPI002604BF32|nr:hypothetical protein [Malikia sp.]MDD2729974.1 hypothetical protein [Malikia sp.]